MFSEEIPLPHFKYPNTTNYSPKLYKKNTAPTKVYSPECTIKINPKCSSKQHAAPLCMFAFILPNSKFSFHFCFGTGSFQIETEGTSNVEPVYIRIREQGQPRQIQKQKANKNIKIR